MIETNNQGNLMLAVYAFGRTSFSQFGSMPDGVHHS